MNVVIIRHKAMNHHQWHTEYVGWMSLL